MGISFIEGLQKGDQILGCQYLESENQVLFNSLSPVQKLPISTAILNAEVQFN